MILYHGSNIEIDEIDFALCKPYKDFGKGFYLTSIKQQAIRMAENRSALFGGEPVVTVYEVDDEEGLQRKLTYRELSNQYSFHTAKAVSYLRKVGTLSE